MKEVDDHDDFGFIKKQDILDAYVVVSDIIVYNIANNQKYVKYYETAQKNIENMFVLTLVMT